MGKTTIQSVHGTEVLDSRGNPTLAVEVVTECGARGSTTTENKRATTKISAIFFILFIFFSP